MANKMVFITTVTMVWHELTPGSGSFPPRGYLLHHPQSLFIIIPYRRARWSGVGYAQLSTVNVRVVELDLYTSPRVSTPRNCPQTTVLISVCLFGRKLFRRLTRNYFLKHTFCRQVQYSEVTLKVWIDQVNVRNMITPM